MTTGNFSSSELLREEQLLQLRSFDHNDALAIGEIAVALATAQNLPVSLEVRMINEELPEGWTVFHYARVGAKPDQPSWIARKARVVIATGHSTMHERVLAEEKNIDWYAEHNLPEKTHAIHGGAIPLNVAGLGLGGILIISGLPQVEDHLFGIQVLTQFLANQGESL